MAADVARTGSLLLIQSPAGSIRCPNGRTAEWEAAWVDEKPGWRQFFYPVPGAPRGTPRPALTAVAAAAAGLGVSRVVLETPDPMAPANWLARLLGVMSTVVNGAPEVAAFGCAVRFMSGAADRVTRIVLDGTEGPVGKVIGVHYERAG